MSTNQPPPFPRELLSKASEITRMLNALANEMGTDLDVLDDEAQAALLKRALELRRHFKSRAERFQAYWIADSD